jgi:hypothetical protein
MDHNKKRKKEKGSHGHLLLKKPPFPGTIAPQISHKHIPSLVWVQSS